MSSIIFSFFKKVFGRDGKADLEEFGLFPKGDLYGIIAGHFANSDRRCSLFEKP